MSIQLKDNKIIFNRTFEAINEVFEAYTTETLFEQWFHPQGGKTKVYRFNPEAGGDAFFAIEMPEQTSYTLTEYKKVDKPNHIEYLDFFATSQGEKDTSLPGMQILIDFTSESAQRTLNVNFYLSNKNAAQQALDMGVAGMNSTLTIHY